jgi:hypothetical protein
MTINAGIHEYVCNEKNGPAGILTDENNYESMNASIN